MNSQPNPLSSDLNRVQTWLKDMFHGASELRGPGSGSWLAHEDDEYKCEEMISVWPRQRASDWLTKVLFDSFRFTSRILPSLRVKVCPRHLQIYNRLTRYVAKDFSCSLPWLAQC